MGRKRRNRHKKSRKESENVSNESDSHSEKSRSYSRSRSRSYARSSSKSYSRSRSGSYSRSRSRSRHHKKPINSYSAKRNRNYRPWILPKNPIVKEFRNPSYEFSNNSWDHDKFTHDQGTPKINNYRPFQEIEKPVDTWISRAGGVAIFVKK